MSDILQDGGRPFDKTVRGDGAMTGERNSVEMSGTPRVRVPHDVSPFVRTLRTFARICAAASAALVTFCGCRGRGSAAEQAGGVLTGDGRHAGEVRTVTLPGGATMDLVWVEPGTFGMGSNNDRSDEKPVREVTLTKGYWIGRTEVTQKQWTSVTGNNPSDRKGDDLPVESVSWDDCLEFMRKVNAAQPELRFALPTEAQWEFAARGGTKSKGFEYAGGDDCGAVAWYDGNSGGLFSPLKTHPVGRKKANELGLHDMSGNVFEWCADLGGSYESGPVTDPTGPSSGDGRVRRGGGWNVGDAGCRSAVRGWMDPDYRYGDVGFRVAASAEP